MPAREAPAPTKTVRPQDGWRLAIRASAAGAVDRNTRLGCAPSAASGWDPSDRSEPPPSPVRGLSVFFPHGDWSGRPGRYTADIRAPLSGSDGSAGQRWSFDVAKNFREEGAGNMVELEFAGIETVPDACEVSLLDRELGRVQDLRESAAYSFHLGVKEPVATAAEARFVVLVGGADFVDGQLDELTAPPLRTALHQNYPNPFNPETVIRCALARAGPVNLRIYDLTGALVRTLQAGLLPAGGHEFVWRGKDDGGRSVASGVYIYRLTTPDLALTKRMTLLK